MCLKLLELKVCKEMSQTFDKHLAALRDVQSNQLISNDPTAPPAGPANAKPKTPAEAEVLQFAGIHVPSSTSRGTAGRAIKTSAASAAMAVLNLS